MSAPEKNVTLADLRNSAQRKGLRWFQSTNTKTFLAVFVDVCLRFSVRWETDATCHHRQLKFSRRFLLREVHNRSSIRESLRIACALKIYPENYAPVMTREASRPRAWRAQRQLLIRCRVRCEVCSIPRKLLKLPVGKSAVPMNLKRGRMGLV